MIIAQSCTALLTVQKHGADGGRDTDSVLTWPSSSPSRTRTGIQGHHMEAGQPAKHHYQGMWHSPRQNPTPWPGTETPSSLELQHTDSAVAPVPCLPSKILTGQAQQCLREEEEAIRKLLAGTNPNLLCWPGCLLLPLQVCNCWSKRKQILLLLPLPFHTGKVCTALC